jgi:hypothetical protein
MSIIRADETVPVHRHADSKRPMQYRGNGRCFFFLGILAIVCLVSPAAATVQIPPSDLSGIAVTNTSAGPQIVHIGIYVKDFTNYNPHDGTFNTNFYLTLNSDKPVNLADIDIVNGHFDTKGTLIDTPNSKYYRIYGSAVANPDFRRYPFDSHVLPIIIEPQIHNTSEMILVIDKETTGLDPSAILPGWQFSGQNSNIASQAYQGEIVPYSQAVFTTGISRDSFSTFLKFFLPVILIIIFSLSTLLMKETTRLGLNASLFLAAVLIHWRIADTIPLVEYATFLDIFMMITYATLVMVPLSGVLILYLNDNNRRETGEMVRIWAIRIIPAITVFSYLVLFLMLLI